MNLQDCSYKSILPVGSRYPSVDSVDPYLSIVTGGSKVIFETFIVLCFSVVMVVPSVSCVAISIVV